MKHNTLKLTMLVGLSLAATHAQAAAGFVALPDTGFASSAYTNCYNDGRVVPYGGIADNTKGNFGSYPIASIDQPSTSKNSTCFVAKPANEIISPIAGYFFAGHRISSIPKTTGGTGNIGQVVDRVWRNAAKNMCIFGTKINMYHQDHDSSDPDLQIFEVNDIARGGFSGSGTVNVAYTIFGTLGYTTPAYRVGRTFTSVQHRSTQYDTLPNKAVNGTNYLDLPTKNSVTTAISGNMYPIASWTPASTTLATQDAAVNSNWVDFTAGAAYFDDDGSSYAHSGFIYIQAACDASNPTTWVKTGAIRLRQTNQQQSSLKEIAVDGFAPPGATVP